MKGISQRLIGFVMLAALVVVAGCGSGRVVLPFQLETGTLVPPRDASALTTHERAVRGLSAILVRDLGLPMPANFTVYVYSGRQVFEQGLIHDAQVTPIRAAELSEFAVGIGKRRQLLLNDDAGQAHGREWLRLIAHELAHVSQIEMAGGEGRAEQWLAEGMSEYVAFAALERLSLDTIANRRSLATAGIRNPASLVAARLGLEALGHPPRLPVRPLKGGPLTA